MNRHQHREIPRHDAANHANRNAAGATEALVAVLGNFLFQIQHWQSARHANAASDFTTRLHMRLALFGGEQTHQLVAVRLDHVGHFGEQGAALFDARFLPGLKRSARSGNGLVEIGLSAIGHLANNLLRRWVYNINPLAIIHQFAVDQIFILGGHCLSPDESLAL